MLNIAMSVETFFFSKEASDISLDILFWVCFCHVICNNCLTAEQCAEPKICYSKQVKFLVYLGLLIHLLEKSLFFAYLMVNKLYLQLII